MAGILSPFLGAGERYAHRPISKSFNLLKNENKKGKVEGVRKVRRKRILSGPRVVVPIPSQRSCQAIVGGVRAELPGERFTRDVTG